MPLLDIFFAMLWFFLFILWIWLLISLFSDIFRRHDISGWGKAGWTIFLIFLPFLGALIYLIADGKGMAERQAKDVADAQQAQADYIRNVAVGGGSSAADQLEKLANLHDAGKLTDEEFAAQKAKILA
jgi:hypothetical protein